LNHPGIRQQQNYIGKKYTWQTLVDISHFNTLCWQRRFWLKKGVGTSTCVCGGAWAQTWQCSAAETWGFFNLISPFLFSSFFCIPFDYFTSLSTLQDSANLAVHADNFLAFESGDAENILRPSC
jgi:hypothetical protein